MAIWEMRGILKNIFWRPSSRNLFSRCLVPDKTRVGWWKNGYPEYFGKVINAIDFIAMDLQIDGQQLI